jgi:hypothetical protein
MKLTRYDYIDAMGRAVVDPQEIQEREDGEYYKADEVDAHLAPLKAAWEKWKDISDFSDTQILERHLDYDIAIRAALK